MSVHSLFGWVAVIVGSLAAANGWLPTEAATALIAVGVVPAGTEHLAGRVPKLPSVGPSPPT